MAVFHVTMKSSALDMSTNLLVLLPTDLEEIPEDGFPVLYLFHGLSDDHTKWMRATRIEEYAAPYHLCVVMPEVQRSFYLNMELGLAYDDFITKELPAFIERTFPVTKRRERTFAAGLSMGGYGAVKTGLREYAKFGACAGLSGVYHPFAFVDRNDKRSVAMMRSALGDAETLPARDDPYALAERQMELPAEQRTRLYLAVGNEDFLRGDNEAFRAHLDNIGFSYTHEEAPGTHNWDFWDEYIQHALAFFFER